MSAARILSAALLVFCGWCAGDAVQAKIAAHEKALRASAELLRRVKQETAYRQLDLAALAAALRREGVLPQGSGALQALEPPPELTKPEAECFKECVSGLGHAPAAQECERLEVYILRFEAFVRTAQEQTAQSAALTRRIGLAAGAAAALFIL